MSKLIHGFLCAVLLVPITSATSRAADFTRYFPDDAEIALRLDVQQLLASDLVKKFALTRAKETLDGLAPVKKLFAILSFDPFTDLNAVTLAGSGGDDPEKGIFVLEGRFDPDRIHGAYERHKGRDDVSGVSLRRHEAGGNKYYELEAPSDLAIGKDKARMFVAVLDRSTIIASPSKELVLEGFARRDGKKQPNLDEKMAALLKSAPNGQTLTLMALSKGLARGGFAEDEKAKELLGKFDSFCTSIQVMGGVRLEIRVDARDGDAAEDLKREVKDGMEQLKAVLDFVAANEKRLAPLGKLADSLAVETKGKTVRVQLEATAEWFEKAMKAPADE
jgi:hypothetical protein